jgi:hypothetical protein
MSMDGFAAEELRRKKEIKHDNLVTAVKELLESECGKYEGRVLVDLVKLYNLRETYKELEE